MPSATVFADTTNAMCLRLTHTPWVLATPRQPTPTPAPRTTTMHNLHPCMHSKGLGPTQGPTQGPTTCAGPRQAVHALEPALQRLAPELSSRHAPWSPGQCTTSGWTWPVKMRRTSGNTQPPGCPGKRCNSAKPAQEHSGPIPAHANFNRSSFPLAGAPEYARHLAGNTPPQSSELRSRTAISSAA